MELCRRSPTAPFHLLSRVADVGMRGFGKNGAQKPPQVATPPPPRFVFSADGMFGCTAHWSKYEKAGEESSSVPVAAVFTVAQHHQLQGDGSR